jgi:tetratricopeptide (TPR) repeat protein
MRRAASLMLVLALCGFASEIHGIDAATDPAAWRRIAMDHALKSLDAVTDPYRLSQGLTGAARAQRLIGDENGAEASLRRAMQIAGRIAAPEFKGWALHDIVQAQIAADDLIGARQTAELITADRPQSSALAAIAGIDLRSGRMTNAQALLARIRDEQSAGEIGRQLVMYQIKAGALPAARETVKQIDDRFYEGLALGDIAVAEVRVGDDERALLTASKAHKSQRAQAVGRVAIARAQRRNFAGAEAALSKIDDVMYRALVQGQIADLRADAGDATGAHEQFQSALGLLDAAPDRNPRKPVTLSQLARLQAAYGDRAGALETLRRAIAAAATLTTGQKDDALDMIARGQLRLSETQSALATALSVDNAIARALLVRDVVAQQVRDGMTLDAVRSAIPKEDPLTETAALFGVLGAQLYMPGRSGAASTIAPTRDTVRAIGDVQLKPAAFAALAAAKVTVGDAAGGTEIFQEALAASLLIEQPDKRAAAYVRIVNALNDRLMFLGQPAQKGEDAKN